MGGGGTKADPQPPQSGKPAQSQATLTLPDGRQVPLPQGVSAEQVQAAMRKRFSGGQLSPSEQAMLRQVFAQFRGGAGAGGGGRGMQRATNEFGGRYIVFVLRAGRIVPVSITTGLTDLDYIEVTSGLTASDTVVVLTSAPN